MSQIRQALDDIQLFGTWAFLVPTCPNAQVKQFFAIPSTRCHVHLLSQLAAGGFAFQVRLFRYLRLP